MKRGQLAPVTFNRDRRGRVVPFDNTADHIMTRVEPEPTSGCWIWTGAWNPKKYGNIKVAGQFQKVHRVLWQALVGPIPPGLDLLHRCNVPPCVNPAHLKLGTNDDNIRQMHAQGRHAVGERAGGALLTETQVRVARTLHRLGWTNQRIAVSLDRKIGTVMAAIYRQTWKHVT